VASSSCIVLKVHSSSDMYVKHGCHLKHSQKSSLRDLTGLYIDMNTHTHTHTSDWDGTISIPIPPAASQHKA